MENSIIWLEERVYVNLLKDQAWSIYTDFQKDKAVVVHKGFYLQRGSVLPIMGDIEDGEMFTAKLKQMSSDDVEIRIME